MKLHFPWDEIEKALQEVRTATTARPFYGKDTGKGLWLVGDQGVYFMPNTTDGIHHKSRAKSDAFLIVYGSTGAVPGLVGIGGGVISGLN